MDFDDDNTETHSSPLKTIVPTEKPKAEAGEDVPPPKPPRPLAPEQQAENTLKEAFPSIDAAVVKAVLRASGGRVEPAFNALLGTFFGSVFHLILKNANGIQACQIQMPQSLLHRHNLQDHNGCQRRAQRLQKKASLRQTSAMLGNLPNTTMEL